MDVGYLVLFVVTLVLVGVSQRRQLTRRRSTYTDLDRQRFSIARERLARYWLRYVVIAPAVVVIVAVIWHQWPLMWVAVAVFVPLIVLVERRRRTVLREVGFELNAWGTPLVGRS